MLFSAMNLTPIVPLYINVGPLSVKLASIQVPLNNVTIHLNKAILNFKPFGAGTDSKRQNLTSIDITF